MEMSMLGRMERRNRDDCGRRQVFIGWVTGCGAHVCPLNEGARPMERTLVLHTSHRVVQSCANDLSVHVLDS